MRHAKWLVPALVLVLALPALAGGKCTAETQECLDKMVQKLKTRGWVGIEMDDSKGKNILEITRVVPGSPAEAAGFQVGDVLLAVNGVKFADNTEEKCLTCEATKDNWTPGTQVHYVVDRGGKEAKVSPTLGQIPPDVMAHWVGRHMLEHADHVEVAQKK